MRITGFNAISLYRWGNLFLKLRLPLFPRMCEGLIFFLFNCSIPIRCKIGKGTVCGHRGIGVVINKNAIIGENCLIRPHVVIGGGGKKPGAPKIGDNVIIGAGAKNIGGVTVGDGAVIGANAVVIHDIPSGVTAVGVPAKIIKPKRLSCLNWKNEEN